MQANNHNWKLQQKTKADINVDCIKVCPFDQKLFAFAYYQQSQTFLGGVSLQYSDQQQQKDLVGKFTILKCGPVLHICWLNTKIDGKYILVGASRSQKIFIFSVIFNQQLKQHEIQLEKQIFLEKNVFCLYVDCFMRNQHAFQITVSTNQSQVFLLNINSKFDQTQQLKTFSKHEYAVWTCRINPFTPNTQFACGDEISSIYLYDQNRILIGKNSKAHQLGICDLVFVNEYKMYSGGFDGLVNQFDLRNFAKPVRTFNLGGIIWRVIPDVTLQKLLICNSSQNKFRIINSVSGQQKWASKTQHGSLAYSADWNKNILLTSSFYDRVVCLWKLL